MATLEYRSAVELRADIASGRVSPVEITERLLERIARLNASLRCYYTVDESGARSAARRAQSAGGERLGALQGVPFSVKDLIATAGIRTTRGSALFEDYTPDFSAPAVERLAAAGGVLLGKTSTSELGWKAVTDCPLFGATPNPWDVSRTAGGSSGGAAAAVASGLGPLALATDAAGSARVPAAFCGVFGLKPSFGRIPIFPAPAADTLVHVGLITRTVADCALLLSVVGGRDDRDRNSLPLGPQAYALDERARLEGKRVAWCPSLPGLPVEQAVGGACHAAVKRLAAEGVAVEEIALELPPAADALTTLFQASFGAQLLDALPRWRDRMDPGLVEFVEAGRRRTAYDVAKASLVRSALWEAIRSVFVRYDLLLLPVTGTAAFPLGGDGPARIAAQEVQGLEWLGYLYPFNLTGQPAASVPCGWTAEGLPVGLQIVGRRFDDEGVLQAAAAFEQINPWAHRQPPFAR